jgi:hypothetical protein
MRGSRTAPGCSLIRKPAKRRLVPVHNPPQGRKQNEGHSCSLIPHIIHATRASVAFLNAYSLPGKPANGNICCDLCSTHCNTCQYDRRAHVRMRTRSKFNYSPFRGGKAATLRRAHNSTSAPKPRQSLRSRPNTDVARRMSRMIMHVLQARHGHASRIKR